ncbi:hypothetical protein NEHOM01_2200 [Nematocida homosporus]|uniref:uncharacterized protein n=1 Tax=Nematocida homosporus TaxID=1912981 RepID=UPI00221E6069|nr:uncharacterized protein NEHOM01_2200 [Nematocida homosporus]KAI5187467.1 hypothetical protein NEHOM01_2200 [Nematocida homosporus]
MLCQNLRYRMPEGLRSKEAKRLIIQTILILGLLLWVDCKYAPATEMVSEVEEIRNGQNKHRQLEIEPEESSDNDYQSEDMPKYEVREGEPDKKPDPSDEEVEAAATRITEFQQGKDALLKGKPEEALSLLATAQTKLDQVENTDVRECVRRAICFNRAKAMIQLDLFSEARTEIMSMQTLKREAITLLQQTMSYETVADKKSEQAISEALKTDMDSPVLLKMRTKIRIKKGLYSLALTDIKKLGKIEEYRQHAEVLEMHCHFLMGYYISAMSSLKKLSKEIKAYRAINDQVSIVMRDYDTADRASIGIMDKYNKFKKLAMTRLKIALALDTRFEPPLLTTFKNDLLNKMINMAKVLPNTGEVLICSQLLLDMTPKPTEENYVQHIRLLLAANKFQQAESFILKKLPDGSANQQAMRKLYNERAAELRKTQADRKKAKQKKAEEDAQKAQEELRNQEKKRSERRKRFVESRRGQRVYDSEGFYKFLGLPEGASKDDVMSAYRRISREANMLRRKRSKKGKDEKRAEEDKQRIVMANKAKDVLSDDIRKAEYDSGLYMTEKEKELWGYNDAAMEQYEENDGRQYQRRGDVGDIFDLLIGGGFNGGWSTRQGAGQGGYQGGYNYGGRFGQGNVVYIPM